MRDELLEVLALQRHYSSANTPAMQRRGQLIRDLIPEKLKNDSVRLIAALGPYGSDIDFQGRDGTGQKTLTPWVRYFSKSRSPSAQNGWYCVYLFDAPGTGLYLDLCHGATTLIDGEYRPRPENELARLVSWGRRTLASAIQASPSLTRPITLRGRELGDAYEHGSVIARWYAAAEIPDENTLYDDAVEFAGYLKLIYDAEAFGLAPTSPPPEVVEVELAAAGGSTRKGIGQGYGLSAAERRAVELHAMRLAKAHLEKFDWRVRDVSSTKPYDFECKRGEDVLIVEVKGTTSGGEHVVVTRNEVAIHRARHPNNALIVVHSIGLERVAGNPKTNGGIILMLTPWKVEEDRLSPLAFQYTLRPDIAS